MVTQKIVCDNCGVEQQEHVYFVEFSPDYIKVSQTSQVDMHVLHACGDRCMMNMVSNWTTRKREKNGNHGTAGSGNEVK